MKTSTIITDAMGFVKDRKGIFKTLTMVGSLLIVQMACMVTVASAVPLPGQIIQDPENPAFMLKNEDKNGDGKLDPFCLVGHGGPESFWYNSQVVNGWDQDSILDYIIEHGGNAIYIVAWGHDFEGSPDPSLYPDWHKWIKKMDQHGIACFFLFYDDHVKHQGDDTLRAIVNEFEAHPNIIWCVCEENWKAKLEVNKIADVIRSADDYGHVIAVHDQYFSACDMLAYQIRSNTILEVHKKALEYFEEGRMSNSAEDHYADVSRNDPDRIRKVIWANAIAGNYFMQLGSWEDKGKRKPPEIAECHYMRYCYEFMMSIPDLNKMRPSDGIVKSGDAWAFGRKNHYILYFENGGSATIDLSSSSGSLNVRWYNPRTGTSHSGSAITAGSSVSVMVPVGNDWVIEIGGASATPTSTLATPTPDQSTPTLIQGGELAKIGTGNMPDIAVDKEGNIHVVYGRDQVLYYKKWTAATGLWSKEEDTGVSKNPQDNSIARADPDIVVDSDGNPYVYAWNGFAKKSGSSWMSIALPEIGPPHYRDTELAIDSKDTVYMSKRGGWHGAKYGFMKLPKGSTTWIKLPDIDEGLDTGDLSDHIYGDLSISKVDGSIHAVQRHGPGKSTFYHMSTDGGKTWTEHSEVTNNEPESPFVQVTSSGTVFVTDGDGNVFRKSGSKWVSEGKQVTAGKRHLPELGADDADNLYIATFGFHYNIRHNGNWGNSRTINRGIPLGFVESAGYSDFAYVVWEEGASVKVYDSTSEKPVPVDIMIGRLSKDGTLSGF